MSARRWSSLIVALLVVSGLGLTTLFAQATTATVKGRVVDTDGSGLPGVVVVIKSKSQPSGNKQVVTDIEGNYRIPLLPPANDYIIRIDYPGFAPMELGPLDLDPGKTTVADLTLRSDAETTETIIVESKGNIVDTGSTKTSSSYNAEFIEGLPIIGSNYQDILTLAPGVTDTDGDGNPNVHGARETGLQYRLDGGNITDPASGTFGQNLNPDIIEELEVITSGASAEYGRADGGFANIITKSGGNDFEGKFSIRWQGKFLNGDGTINNNDINQFEDHLPSYRDLRPILSLGGAIVKDRLWYFSSLEILDTEIPLNQIGNSNLITSRGNYGFGKVTWQVNSFNKLAVQVNTDPRTFSGFNLGLGVSPDSDFEFKQGGITPQLKWTSTVSPQLLLESQVTRLNSGISLDPVSKYFEPTEIDFIQLSNSVQALYPCEVQNCNPTRGEKRTYIIDVNNGRVSGPFNFKNDDSRTRNSIKTDLSYSIEDAWGQHSIKTGIEFQDEKFFDEPINNPVLIDVTEPFQATQGTGGGGGTFTDEIQGIQLLLVSDPLITPQRASSFNSGAYIYDSWKPRPNLTLNIGFRVDREDIDTSGFGYFDPQQERRSSISLWSNICAAAVNQGLATSNSNCTASQGYNGLPPTEIPDNSIRVDNNGNGMVDLNDPIERDLSTLDLNNNGIVSNQGEEGDAFYQRFTSYQQTRFGARETNNFSIDNNNFSPRFSVSWDPWSDGKTKTYGSWGRFYDRLFLDTVSAEIGPDTLAFLFVPDQNHFIQAAPNPAVSRQASTITVNQVDRNLKTPYTDELTIGIERELAPEWSASFTYIRRKGYDLLQDVDLNHITCPQHQEVLGLSPQVICELEFDKFGDTGARFSGGGGSSEVGGDFSFDPTAGGVSLPNRAPDLYTVNNNFNQILRVGNNNSSDYRAYEVKVTKRLHRNWQMQASYTWSEAFGQAENFQSGLGNDPETRDDEEGYLQFDQRHLLKFQAVTRLPGEISLGTNIQWASGLPFSVLETVVDTDSTGNQIFRVFYPTSQRNDQRNSGFWKIDARIEKSFSIGKVEASGFFAVENLLNDDWLNIGALDIAALNGVALRNYPGLGLRDIGRRFELGASFNF